MYVYGTRMYTHSTLKHSMVIVRLYFQYIKLWETVVTIRLYFYRYDYGTLTLLLPIVRMLATAYSYFMCCYLKV